MYSSFDYPLCTSSIIRIYLVLMQSVNITIIEDLILLVNIEGSVQVCKIPRVLIRG